MKDILFLECYAGLSGDMAVASLLDLGADKDKLLEALKTIAADGFEIKITNVEKNKLSALDFDVVLDKAHDNHDHDMEYLYGHTHEDGEHHHHEHHHEEHSHHEGHSHHSHTHTHEHRNLEDVVRIIDSSAASDNAKKIAKDIFEIVAEAESKVHGEPIDRVHFHEVGAVDSIVDILSFAICLDDLDFEGLAVSALAEGTGTVRCQHGILPIPVPAVAQIAVDHGLKLRQTNVSGELVTPTGAAIAAYILGSEKYVKLPDEYTITGIGVGAGKRDYNTSGIVRAMRISTEK